MFRGVTRCYKMLKGVTRFYRVLQGAYTVFHGVTLW